MLFNKNFKNFSTKRVEDLLNNYLKSPLIIDIEYIKNYTIAHQKLNETNSFKRISFCHGYALEKLTPIIAKNELIIGKKTRFTRGSIPYCNYSSGYVLREIQKFEKEKNLDNDDYQDHVHSIGSGGGFEINKNLLLNNEDFYPFGKKHLIPKGDLKDLKEISKYWLDKNFQYFGDKLWKNYFKNSAYIENGWKSVLYTGAHDPCPEGRFVLDFETALKYGFKGIIERLKNKIKETNCNCAENGQKIFFWESGIKALESTIKWVNNYGLECKKLAEIEKDEKRKRELNEIHERCFRVPLNAPKNFIDAIQCFWFIYLAGHLEGAHLGYSPGRFDRYMYPFYQKDIKEGKITQSKVLELLELLRIKFTEIEYIASFSWESLGSGNLFQNLCIGGLNKKGKNAENELSKLILQSAINCPTIQPTLSILYHPQLSNEFLLKGAECVKTGIGFPAFFNLKVLVQHELAKKKLDVEDIYEYSAMGGCTEPTIEGHSYGIVQPGFINHGKLFELALFGGVCQKTKNQFTKTKIPNNFNELKDAYLIHLKDSIENWQKYWNMVMMAHKDTTNLIYCSVLTRDCIEKGLSLDDKGARINHTPTTLSSGLVNVANSFSSIKKLCEIEKKYTFNQVREALRKNFKGNDKMFKEMINAPKFGNNDDFVDDIFVELFDVYCNYVKAGKNYLDEPYDPSFLAISTHIPFGKGCIASPDGRLDGSMLADGVTSPYHGTDKLGPYAVINSSSKVDHTKIRGGLLNMKFTPSCLNGISGSQKLISLIKTYFQSNGFQIQFNIVDSKKLIDAQKHPEEYRNLIVRVAGFSAYFVELSKEVQDEVIKRTEHCVVEEFQEEIKEKDLENLDFEIEKQKKKEKELKN